MLRASGSRRSRYIPVVAGAFLLELLYGSKFAPNFGNFPMPFIYVKSILLCASAREERRPLDVDGKGGYITQRGLGPQEAQYLLGLIEWLIPSSESTTKVELSQFIEASINSSFLSPDRQGSVYDVYEDSSFADKQRYSSDDDHGRNDGAVGDEDYDNDNDSHSDDGADVDRSLVNYISSSVFPQPAARVLLYDIVKTCLANNTHTKLDTEGCFGEQEASDHHPGSRHYNRSHQHAHQSDAYYYSGAEKERVKALAAHVGVPSLLRESIEKIALQEHVLANKKAKILMGDAFTAADLRYDSMNRHDYAMSERSHHCPGVRAHMAAHEGEAEAARRRKLKSFLRHHRQKNRPVVSDDDDAVADRLC